MATCGMGRPMKGKEGMRLPWFNTVAPNIAKVSADTLFQLCNAVQSFREQNRHHKASSRCAVII